MKKNLLALSTVLMIAVNVFGQTKVANNPIVIINSGNSISCNAGGIITTDNSFYHVYDLDNYPGIVDTAFIVRMKVACESTTGGPYNIVGRVYKLVGTPSIANLTFVSDDTVAIYPDSSMYRINIPFDQGYVLPGDSLASELKLPTNATASFYPGSNTSPESSPTYLVAAGCGIVDFTTTTTVGFPDMHLIMNLYLNQRPTMAGFTSNIFKDDSVYFTDTDFTAVFDDNDNDGVTMIKVASLPTNGILDLNGTTLVLGDTVYTSEMNQLYYIPNTGYFGADNFSFRARDTSHWSLAPAVVDVDVINWQLGVDENAITEVVVYPNPASKQITVQVADQIKQIRIFNAEGKLVMTRVSDENVVDISKLENGIYFIEVKTNIETITNRFIKE